MSCFFTNRFGEESIFAGARRTDRNVCATLFDGLRW